MARGAAAAGGRCKRCCARIGDPFFFLVLLTQGAFVVLFVLFTHYETASSAGVAVTSHNASIPALEQQVALNTVYPKYIDVAVMVFVGFGFLMTFMNTHSYSAVGFTTLVAAFCVQWTILCVGLFERIVEGGPWNETISVGLAQLTDGQFGAASILISFGAILGKVGPGQMLLYAFLEVLIYSANYMVGVHIFKAIDIGGSMYIHIFGAYFGLASSFFISPRPRNDSTMKRIYEEGVKAKTSNDLFSMIGTLFLWLYWPSFNSALAPLHTQLRVIVNTLLSQCGSCVCAFAMSRMLRGGHRRFDMVDIQNATIAGGVAAGTAAELMLSPGGAIGLGMAAGVLSAIGFAAIMPCLDRTLGLKDSCGVHNLHGMPGVLAAVTGIIATAYGAANSSIYGDDYGSLFQRGALQPLYQTYTLLTTLGMAIVGGILTGVIVRVVTKQLRPEELFSDRPFWEVPSDYSDAHLSDGKLLFRGAGSSINIELGKVTPVAPRRAGGASSADNSNADSGQLQRALVDAPSPDYSFQDP